MIKQIFGGGGGGGFHVKSEADLGLRVQAVQVMTRICRESEASLDYSALFKAIIRRAPIPMTPLESLASSAVRTAHKVGPLLDPSQLLSHSAVAVAGPSMACTGAQPRPWGRPRSTQHRRGPRSTGVGCNSVMHGTSMQRRAGRLLTDTRIWHTGQRSSHRGAHARRVHSAAGRQVQTQHPGEQPVPPLALPQLLSGTHARTVPHAACTAVLHTHRVHAAAGDMTPGLHYGELMLLQLWRCPPLK